jgi:hypothetical protein
VLTSAGTGTVPAYSATPALTSVDMGGTTVYGSRAITVDTGGVLNIVLASSAGDDFTVDTNRLVVSGDETAVGINTAAPVSLLDVRGPTGTGTAPAGLLTLATNELTVVDGDQLGRVEFRAPLESSGTDAIVSAASIWAEANATFSSSVNSADIVFATATSGAAAERMRITSAGLVGIGTAAPSYTFQTTAARSASTDMMALQATGTGVANDKINLLFRQNTGADGSIYSLASIASLNQDISGANGSLVFSTMSATTLAERMRITSLGLFGLGTTTPTAKLDIIAGSTAYSSYNAGAINIEGSTDRHFGFGIDESVGTNGSAWISAQRAGVGALPILIQPELGNVAIGNTSPQSTLHVTSADSNTHGNIQAGGNSTGLGSLFNYQSVASGYTNICMLNNSGGVNGRINLGFGVINVSGEPTNKVLAINQSGNVDVSGVFTAGTKTFRIPHPLPEKSENYLVHGCLEGPRLDLIYRGVATLVDGVATVDLDDAAGMSNGTWVLLCRDPMAMVINATGFASVRGSVSGNSLTITCEEGTCTDSVSWLVVAERQDDAIKAQSSTDEDGRLILEPLIPPPPPPPPPDPPDPEEPVEE